MTRICSWCNKELGEKCPVCGSPAVALEWPALPDRDVGIFVCAGDNPKCANKLFERGLGGTTDGICEECGPLLQEGKSPLAQGGAF